jgi:hypothetical protein
MFLWRPPCATTWLYAPVQLYNKAQSKMPDPVDELRNPHKAKDDFFKYLRHEVFTLNFYRAHMLYFIVVIAISSGVVYGVGVARGPKEYRDDHLTYMDALFLCTSAMTTTGNVYSSSKQWDTDMTQD